MPKTRTKTQEPEAEYLLRPSARQDIMEIAAYSKAQWGTEQRDKYVQQLDKTLKKLARNPEMARKRDELGDGYRTFIVGKHTVLFQQTNQHIQIARITHERMDLEREFHCFKERSLNSDKRRREKKRSLDKGLDRSR